MTKITKQEALKIAQISSISVHESEIDAIAHHLEQVLTYAERVQELAVPVQASIQKNVNVFRADVIIKTDPETILACAPEEQEHYFVVPAILESNK